MINRVHSTLMHDMQTITKNKKICMHESPKNKKKRKPPDQEFIWSRHYSQLLALYIFLVRSCWESLNSCTMSKDIRISRKNIWVAQETTKQKQKQTTCIKIINS